MALLVLIPLAVLLPGFPQLASTCDRHLDGHQNGSDNARETMGR